MNNENNLRNYAQNSVRIKRFSYVSGSSITLVRPKEDEQFYISEDYLGTHSILWVSCVNSKGEEKWRHNINQVVRITFFEPLQETTLSTQIETT